jgi:polyisoprenoid-binding protein YceI
MNVQLSAMAALVALTMASCGSGEAGNTIDTTSTDSIAKETTYTVDPALSKVTWAGTMLGVKTHTGDLAISRGTVTAKAGALVGGTFTVDLKQPYAMTDTFYTKDYTKEKLMGHLMSPDFFNVDSFPTANLTIKSVSGNTATGDLTVRGKTNEETVTDIVITESNGTLTASGKMTFDRQKYNVAWSSGSKDMVLSDDIVLQVNLSGKAQ